MEHDHSVWVLDDEEDCLFVAEQSLSDAYNVRTFSSLAQLKGALDQNLDTLPVALVADLRLADGNFLQFLDLEASDLAKIFPIVITSSLYDSETIRGGYHRGSYDYLVKPFRPSELKVKVEQASQKFVSDRSRRVASQLELTPKEARLFEYMHRFAPRAVSRQELLAEVWADMKIHPKTIDVHIHNLKKKIVVAGWIIVSSKLGFWSITSAGSSGDGVPPSC